MEVTITLTEEQVAKIDMLLNTSQSFNFDDEVRSESTRLNSSHRSLSRMPSSA